MLQLQPQIEIILDFIYQTEYKYMTAIGCLYLRLVEQPKLIYQELEKLYTDYRKLRLRESYDFKILHMDEYIDQLLHEEYVCNILLPTLPTRYQLENLEDSTLRLSPRISPLIQKHTTASPHHDQNDDSDSDSDIDSDSENDSDSE